jgi:hypothetical protein
VRGFYFFVIEFWCCKSVNVLKVADEAVKILIITRLQTVSLANNNKTKSRCKNATLSANPSAPKLILII